MTVTELLAFLTLVGGVAYIVELVVKGLPEYVRARADASLVGQAYSFADLYLVATESVRRGRLVGEDPPEELIDRMANTVLEDLEAGVLSPHGDSPEALER